MAESLKTFFSSALVSRLAATLVAVEPSFPQAQFTRQASAGLQELELIARAKHIAETLARHLPQDYPQALKLLLSSLGPKHATDELLGVGMGPFFYLPHLFFIMDHGLEHFELSLEAQYEITQRCSAEGSIRTFIDKDPERCFTQFQLWVKDRNPHVRRLVSEGTRLRLPWAARVAWLDKNPEPVLSVLELLKDDPSSLVRRSVANNLNDLGKVYPQLLLKTCTRWLLNASPERRALIEHALRGAVKRADAGALSLLGFGSKPQVAIVASNFRPVQVVIGDSVALDVVLKSESRRPQDLLIDFAVHFIKANGAASPKVFKFKRLRLLPDTSVSLTTRISLAVHTTRKPYPGVHAVELLLNGVAQPLGAFEVAESAGSAKHQSPPAQRKTAKTLKGALSAEPKRAGAEPKKASAKAKRTRKSKQRA